jgi:hypothetical protein
MKNLTQQEVLRNLTPWQVDVLLSKAQFRVLLCGRQVGKTNLLRAVTYKESLESPKEILYLAKTHGQVKEVAWRHMVGGNNPLFHPSLIKSKNNSELSVELKNGSRICFSGTENEDALLGRTIDLVLLDEFQSMDKNVWHLIQPMLAARNGRAIFAGTARGFDHLYDFWWKGCLENPNRETGWRSWKIITPNCGTPAGSPEAIRAAKSSMTKQQFEQEYLASPYANQGAVYSIFDHVLNNSNNELDIKKPLLIGIDFNVSAMTAIICQTDKIIVDKKEIETLHVIEEVILENSNTQILANVLKNKYSQWQGRIICYPDPAGNSRKTSANLNSTDHEILRQAGFTLQFKPAHPVVNDRVNSVNMMLCNANNLRRLFINLKNCPKVLKMLLGLTYDSSGAPDKKSGLDHASDALGYLIDYRYGIRTNNVIQQTFAGKQIN